MGGQVLHYNPVFANPVLEGCSGRFHMGMMAVRNASSSISLFMNIGFVIIALFPTFRTSPKSWTFVEQATTAGNKESVATFLAP